MRYKKDHILLLKPRILENFTMADWEEIGMITGLSYLIDGHPRLLRSLKFNDEDYEANILRILRAFSENSTSALELITEYLDRKYPMDDSIYISSEPATKKISFSPNVFKIPDCDIDENLIAVMMPFSGFDNVYTAIKSACAQAEFDCLRADDLWDESTIIQDIFNLIYRSKAVIVDFSNKNANVMYETGIAHTLGKLVIPITQSIQDIPSDMTHHRALKYLNNGEGCNKLAEDLAKKLRSIKV